MKTLVTSLKIPARLLFFILPVFMFGSCNQQVSVTPPDLPPPNGFIYIASYPEGFHIYLDGKARRRATPDSLTWLITGTYQVTLKKDFFRDTTFTVSVVEGKKETAFVDYSKNPSMLGNINCTSNPSQAQISINDSTTNMLTPKIIGPILPGIYRLKYHMDKHRDVIDTVIVTSGNVTNSAVTLVDTTIWQNYTTDNSGILSDNLTCVLVDKNNVLWIGTDKAGFLSYNGAVWKQYTEANSSMPDNHVNCLAMDASGLLFVGTNRGFVTFDGFNMHMYGFRTSGLPDFYVHAITFDNNDNWYIATQGGLTEAYASSEHGYWFTWDTETIPDKWITSLLFDNKGMLWAGMKNYGIARRGLYNSWEIFNYNNTRMVNNNVTALAQGPDGSVWIGFDQTALAGSGITYVNNSSWNNVYPIPQQSKTNVILVDRMNTKWIGTNQGLVSFTNAADAVTYSYSNTGLYITDITGLAIDGKGYIWIATNGQGLIRHKMGY